jgi:RHS repeat-associated protein
LKTLKTWQNYTADTGAAITTWNYDTVRGLLQNKRYADNTGPSYTYWPSGRLRVRNWARGVSTTYSYNTVGDLITVDYSDSTPDVTIQYDRSGRPKSMTDAAGTRTLSYHSSGQLQDEIYTAGLLNGFSVARGFDALQRINSISVNSASSVLNQIGYSYDAASRLDTVSQGANTATYFYVPNSSLVGGVTIRQNLNVRLTTTKSYDFLNRLSSISSAPSASSVLSSGYSYNSANQRTKLTRENNAYWDYGYDNLGQVTSAKKRLSDGAVMLGHDFAYSFDDIGNRKTATANGQLSTYTANVLNQYASKSVPGSIDVFGEAKADSIVTLTVGTGLPQVTTRQGDSFFKQLSVDNTTLPVASSIKVTGAKNLIGPAGEDAVTELTRLAFTPKTPEVFSHDADGNLTADAKWIYTWDGENRLIAVETQPTAVTAGLPKQRLEFVYDGQSRRIAKKVYNWDGAAWQLGSSTRFLYDGWNMIAELDALNSNSLVRTHTWGADLSGSFQGAGGVCGLLFTTLHVLQAASHAPACDGNGNIIGYVDMATGVKSGTYEYSAFGETLTVDGLHADNLPYRFSTHYHDQEAGLLYAKNRFIRDGRFLSRDPLEENGGSNLYGFVGNDPVNYFDPWGLYPGVEGHGGPISPENSVSKILEWQRKADANGDISTRNRLQEIMPLVGNPEPFNTNEGNLFVYTCKYGWVDMGHFFRNATGVNRLGKPATYLGAMAIENLQSTYGRAPEISPLLKKAGVKTSKSGYAVEDLSSNALGRKFARDIEKKNKGSAADVAYEWRLFLKEAGAVKWGPGVEAALRKDMSDYGDLPSMPRAYSAREGRRWMKSQEVHKCLCDGDVPKAPNRF